MKGLGTRLIIVAFLTPFSTAPIAGPLADNQLSIDLTRFGRDSDSSVDYVFDNGGTVNSAPDDTPLGSTGEFDDDADTGYIIAGSLQFNQRWSLNVGLINSEMDSGDRFVDAGGQLEIFRLPLTNEFDAANLVEASYESEWSGLDINAVYRFNDAVDFFAGLGSHDLDEHFRILSDDTGTGGVGRYTIRTSNEMQGLHVGVALNYLVLEKLGVYFVGKLGSYDNDTSQRQRVSDLAFSRSNRESGSTTTMLSDLRLGLNYHFSEQMILDFGYHLITMDDVALAESQFDTSAAGPSSVVDGDEIQWDGFSLGLKYAF